MEPCNDSSPGPPRARVILLALFLGIILDVLSVPVRAENVTHGLIGFYTFDNQGFTDSSGHNHTGTARGPVAFGSGVGDAGYAMSVQASPTPGGVDLPPHPFSQTASLSVAFWFYPSATQATQYAAMVYRQSKPKDVDHSTDRAFAVWWIPGGVHVVYTPEGANSQYICTNQSFNLGSEAWHHFALTLDSETQIAKVYLDGALVKKCPYSGGMLASGHRELVLGNLPRGYRGQPEAGPFTGSLDNVRFYKRRLRAIDVQALYANGE